MSDSDQSLISILQTEIKSLTLRNKELETELAAAKDQKEHSKDDQSTPAFESLQSEVQMKAQRVSQLESEMNSLNLAKAKLESELTEAVERKSKEAMEEHQKELECRDERIRSLEATAKGQAAMAKQDSKKRREEAEGVIAKLETYVANRDAALDSLKVSSRLREEELAEQSRVDEARHKSELSAVESRVREEVAVSVKGELEGLKAPIEGKKLPSTT